MLLFGKHHSFRAFICLVNFFLDEILLRKFLRLFSASKERTGHGRFGKDADECPLDRGMPMARPASIEHTICLCLEQADFIARSCLLSTAIFIFLRAVPMGV